MARSPFTAGKSAAPRPAASGGEDRSATSLPTPAMTPPLADAAAATPAAATASSPSRGRGRPPAAPAVAAGQRQRLLEATAAVFARTGYHGLAVELVAAEAGLSRPTFYKHFRNTDEAIEIVIQDVNDRLIAALLAAVAGQASPFAALEAALLAWRDWGHGLGPMLRPLFAELHDAHSPASRHRLRTLAILAARLRSLMQEVGFPPPPRLQVDSFLNGMEYLGYRFHLQTPGDAASWQETRDGMLRLGLGILGNSQVWANAAELARALDINLDRVAEADEPGGGDASAAAGKAATAAAAIPAANPATPATNLAPLAATAATPAAISDTPAAPASPAARTSSPRGDTP